MDKEDLSMKRQVHKRLSNEQVIEVLKKYGEKQINLEQGMLLLGSSRRRFYDLLSRYREGPERFSVQYRRASGPRVEEKTEQLILKELKEEKKLITNHGNTVRRYNYSYVQERLREEHDVRVSLPTIIDRAKKTIIGWDSRRRASDTTARC